MSSDLPLKSSTVSFKPMDEGGVLFCSRTEVYFGVNRIGAAIWDRLPMDVGVVDGGFDGLLDTLQQMYPDVDRGALADDVRHFLAELEESELVAYGRSEKNQP